MDTQKISVCILVKNAQDTILECLNSLSEFGEIILLDNESNDDTLNIAKNFNQTYQKLHIYSSKFIGFGKLKNLALSYAKNEWILSIDSDEVLEKEALEELKALELTSNSIIALPRKNLYRGEWIKACGWYPDFVWRVFNKNFTRFNDNFVHESVLIPTNSQKIKFKNGFKHYAFKDISHLLDKAQHYSSLWANQNLDKSSNPIKATIRSIWAFIRSYFLKKGIMYGYKGFVISICNALGVFFKYMKLYENTQHFPCSLIITTYNQKERLALVLDSVRNLSSLPLEVIIADDGSTKDTADLIQSYQVNFPCILKHVWQEDLGFRLSEIRNKAINSAKGKYIIIIDGDMILQKHFVKDHFKFAKKGVFLQGSRTILEEKESEKLLKAYEKAKDEAGKENVYKLAFKGFKFKAFRCVLLAKLIYKNSTIKADIFKEKELIKGIRGCNMSFFKSDFEALAGFNEKFIGWGREDSEFVARFLFNGGCLRRLKFAGIAYHIYHQENTKQMLEINHKIYLDTIQNKKIIWQ